MNKNLLIIFCCISADVGFVGFVKEGPEYPEDYEGPQGYDFTKDPWVNTDLKDEKWSANRAQRKLPDWMQTVDLRHLCSGSKNKKETKQKKQHKCKLLLTVTITITLTITKTITANNNNNNNNNTNNNNNNNSSSSNNNHDNKLLKAQLKFQSKLQNQLQ